MHALLSSFIAETGVDPVSIGYGRLGVPPALVFADDAGRRSGLTAIASSHARAVVALPIAQAAARLELQASGLVILDIVEDAGALLDDLLDQVERAVAARLSLVLIARAELIDIVARIAESHSVALLIEPEDDEIAAAIDAVLVPREASLADSASESNGSRLRELSEEIGRIARALASLSTGAAVAPAVPAEPRAALSRLQTARAEIRLRRMREQFFERTLFADPAWDMLLDLATAQLERRRVAVSSLCIAAAVPPTTALRWIAQMTEQGLLSRYPDPDDGRRVFIALTEPASAGMTRYLDACAATRAG